MKKPTPQLTRLTQLALLVASATLYGCSSSDDDSNLVANDIDDEAPLTPDASTAELRANMDFFLTSVGPGDGANLGGLAGADAHCSILAEAAGSTGREWRAYLSATGVGGGAVENAIERIGTGPWVNANGVVVAESPENLLDADNNNVTRETAVSEIGETINGLGEVPLRHDILTGTQLDGMAAPVSAGDTTCGDWTSNAAGNAFVGHHDRDGGGSDPTSWSTAHGTRGCSQGNLQSTGGDGLFYCFAQN